MGWKEMLNGWQRIFRWMNLWTRVSGPSELYIYCVLARWTLIITYVIVLIHFWILETGGFMLILANVTPMIGQKLSTHWTFNSLRHMQCFKACISANRGTQFVGTTNFVLNKAFVLELFLNFLWSVRFFYVYKSVKENAIWVQLWNG